MSYLSNTQHRQMGELHFTPVPLLGCSFFHARMLLPTTCPPPRTGTQGSNQALSVYWGGFLVLQQ